MAFDYSTTNLIASIRDITNAGSSQQDWPDVRLLRVINREIDAFLVPFIEEARKEHFDTYTDTPLVDGQATYYLPSKAMGGKLRAAQLVDASGNPYAPLVEIPLEQGINLGVSIGSVQQGIPSRYWFKGNQMVLSPTPSGSATLSLRLYHPNRPSTLVTNSACIQVTSLPGGAPTGSLRIGFTGTAPVTYAVSTSVDAVQNRAGFDVLLSGTISAVAAGTLDITGTQPAELQVGDWICLADTAPVVTGAIPDMVIGCLIKKVALEVMAGKADDGAFNRLRVLLEMDKRQARQFLRRRNEGDHPKASGGMHRFKTGPNWL